MTARSEFYAGAKIGAGAVSKLLCKRLIIVYDNG